MACARSGIPLFSPDGVKYITPAYDHAVSNSDNPNRKQSTMSSEASIPRLPSFAELVSCLGESSCGSFTVSADRSLSLLKGEEFPQRPDDAAPACVPSTPKRLPKCEYSHDIRRGCALSASDKKRRFESYEQERCKSKVSKERL
mmetsp:Transcript_9339/g.16090  ORF Transcript_9339/g.16090 Transcript_9339/m.16090 type:complete len:144 (-) Transcript_9339:249-680(-)